MRQPVLITSLLVVLTALGGPRPMLAEGCRSIGRPGVATATPFEDLERGMSRVNTVGELNIGFEANFLCPPSYSLSASRIPVREDCYWLYFSWQQIGISERDGLRILRQWAGRKVVVEGELRPIVTSIPLRQGQVSDKGGIVNVWFVGLADGEGAEAYCPGSDLPALPSVWEERTRRENPKTPVCRDEAHTRPRMETSYCIDPTEPTIWQTDGVRNENGSWIKGAPRKIPFVPPAPYSTRDIDDLAVLKGRFFFTLTNRELYYWDGESSKKLRDAQVDLLDDDSGDWVYYRVRRMSPMRTIVWNSIERVDSAGSKEVVWESDHDMIINYGIQRSYGVPQPEKLRIVLSTEQGVRILHCDLGVCQLAEE